MRKKVITFIILTFTLFAETNIHGFIGGGGSVGEDLYTNERTFQVAPVLGLSYKNISLSYQGLSIQVPMKNPSSFLDLNFNYNFNGIKEGKDIDGHKILKKRENAMGAKLTYNKLVNGINFSFAYNREFTSNANILSTSVNTIITKQWKYLVMFMPILTYSHRDSNYANYYYTLTKEEASQWGQEYKEVDEANELSLGLLTNVVLTKKIGVIFQYNYNIIDNSNLNLVKNSTNQNLNLILYYQF